LAAGIPERVASAAADRWFGGPGGAAGASPCVANPPRGNRRLPMGKYHLEKAQNGQFHWSLRADNGERILHSEMYTTKAAALNGIESCRKNSPEDGQYERLMSRSEQPYFTLKAKNHEVIGASEMYSSVQARDNGIESCKKNGPDAELVDKT
jgi:uncharacterized protein YegP (UPF0339 family)